MGIGYTEADQLREMAQKPGFKIEPYTNEKLNALRGRMGLSQQVHYRTVGIGRQFFFRFNKLDDVTYQAANG